MKVIKKIGTWLTAIGTWIDKKTGPWNGAVRFFLAALVQLLLWSLITKPFSAGVPVILGIVIFVSMVFFSFWASGVINPRTWSANPKKWFG